MNDIQSTTLDLEQPDFEMLIDGFELFIKELAKIESKLEEQVKKQRERHDKKYNTPFGYESEEELREVFGYGGITQKKFDEAMARFNASENFKTSKVIALNLAKSIRENYEEEKRYIIEGSGMWRSESCYRRLFREG